MTANRYPGSAWPSMVASASHHLLAACLLVTGTWATAASPLTISVSDQTGLPDVQIGGPAVTTQYLFFGANWAWSQQDAKVALTAPFNHTMGGANKALGLAMNGSARKQGENQWVWQWEWLAERAMPEAIGGGMVFKFDLAAYAARMGEPMLLPDKRGWAWGKAGGERVEMRFDPPLADVFFEQGRKNELRAYFYGKGIQPGTRSHQAVLSVAQGKVVPSRAQRHGAVDTAAWPTGLLDPATSPVDLSFLNAQDKPAGKRGFVRAAGDKLQFADGTPARFWGTNISAYALFGTPKDAVRQQAARLSALGFNLVRIHHHDSPWVNPNVFGDGKTATTTELNPASMDKLDWWIKCLKDEGIYVWLDLHVQRHLKPADGIDAFDEMAKGKPAADLKGFNYVSPSIQAAMRRFNDDYLSHLNPYTERRYKDEPAVVALMLTNENDVTGHFGNALLPDKKVPVHNATYMAAAERFANANGLPKDKTWRSWEPGPGKLFLNDLEYRVNAAEAARLRTSGVRTPIASTSLWGYNGLSSLPALTAGDVTDAHAYAKTGELELDPAYQPTLVHWLATAHLANRPMTVTEWNMDARLEADRHTIPLYVAASAAHQGWDAMMHYAYSQEPLRGAGTPSVWHGYNDPAVMALMPAAALMYRQSHVSEATSVYAYMPSRAALFNDGVTAATSQALRSAVERGKLVIGLPQVPELTWLSPEAAPDSARVVQDAMESLLPPDAAVAASDNGELKRNWAEGHFTVDTPRSQAVSGWVGGKALVTADASFALETASASVVVQSLDERPMRQSADILITSTALAMPGAQNRTPFLSEPIKGTLTVAALRGLRLYAWDANARRYKATPVTARNGKYVVDFDALPPTHWLRLSKTHPSGAR